MTSLLALRDAIASGLAADARLVALKASVSVHGGDFRLDDLQRYGKNAPAVVVSLLHVDLQTDATAETWAECTFAVACVAKPRPPADQHAVCVELVDAALRALRGSFWGQGATYGLQAPRQLTARNLFGAGLDKVGGIAMWAIGFHQTVQLLDTDDGVPFERWHSVLDPQPTDTNRPHMEDQGELDQ